MGQRNFLRGYASADERAFVTALPAETKPGTKWEYHSSAYRLLYHVLPAARDETLEAYTDAKLVKPLASNRNAVNRRRRGDDFQRSKPPSK